MNQPPDAEASAPRLLTRPDGEVADLVTTTEALAECAQALSDGSGPVGVDAERAHGFRYSSRAYLIQLRRHGAPTFLIDPIPFRDGEAEADLTGLLPGLAEEWILHAASQDLPCLTEVGLVPTALFDTELAGRLLGYPRVSLGTLTEELLGIQLLKEHSAADWSTRPLPPDWLAYAALDVELLDELRAVLAEQLEAAGKAEWARQEFAYLVEHAQDPARERTDPWRRTSGVHQLRSPRALNVVRELWTARDEIARRLDKAPGKILADRAISEAALELRSADRKALRSLSGFQRRQARRYESNWLAAIETALAAPDTELPRMHLRGDGPPQPRSWARRHPEAAARLDRCKAHVQQLSDDLRVPTENLLTPDTLRRLAWQPPDPVDEDSVATFLADHDARPWQRDLLAAPLARLL
ncbi:MAG TPA: ribonuclease D [Candidatus Avipropionibacterium avicola]|uniref:Ribonuclease D n=1 Tax=Candidatus Avipropionibacterium avicola TaxID=2840701 RepID=A0A9D1KMS4_9ACTN|nr:ribonuclease D [Candidatus Avipropionibacterium avicola]